MSFFEKEFSQHDRALIDLNIRTLDLSWATDSQGGNEIENEDIPFLLESLRWDIVRQHNSQINKRTIERATKMVSGWCITPFFGLAERAETNYFRFKPEFPPADWKNPGKPQKYLGAKDVSPRAYLPNVTAEIWQRIADRYQVPIDGDSFGDWVLNHPKIPAIPTEGEKKALAAMALGYVAISLPGIDCGYSSKSDRDDGRDSQLSLIPDLQALAAGGRKIFIAFDRESAPKTIKRVNNARRRLAALFAKLGSETYSVKWPDEYKGLDDFIFGAGESALDEAIANAQSITPQAKPEKDGDNSTEKNPPAVLMAKQVLADLFAGQYRFDTSDKQYWEYDGRGKWNPRSDEYIFGAVQEYLEERLESFSPTYVVNVIRFALKDILCEGWAEVSSFQYMPFTNGVLELASNQLLPHSLDYGFTWQLPRDYSIIATDWPKILDFIKFFCCGDQELGAVVLATCNAILKGRSDLQKFLYLFGSGGNGKGALITLATMLVGPENTHSTNMTDFNENRFECGNIRNKRLVVMTDEDRRAGGKFGTFKAATGGDRLRDEKKGKNATTFVFRGFFVIAANSPTFAGESNAAIDRRKIPIPALARPKEDQIRDLMPEFEADVSAFTTYLLSLPDEWVTAILKGAKNVKPIKDLSWELALREDSIAAFYDEHLLIDAKAETKCGELYSKYEGYCASSGLKPKSLNNFTPSLLELCNTRLGHSIERKHTRLGKVIFGLRIRQEFEDSDLKPEAKKNNLLSKREELFLPNIEKWSQSSQMTIDKGLKVVTEESQAVTVVTEDEEF
jgi:putative DNA primase/helicase